MRLSERVEFPFRKSYETNIVIYSEKKNPVFYVTKIRNYSYHHVLNV